MSNIFKICSGVIIVVSILSSCSKKAHTCTCKGKANASTKNDTTIYYYEPKAGTNDAKDACSVAQDYYSKQQGDLNMTCTID